MINESNIWNSIKEIVSLGDDNLYIVKSSKGISIFGLII